MDAEMNDWVMEGLSDPPTIHEVLSLPTQKKAYFLGHLLTKYPLLMAEYFRHLDMMEEKVSRFNDEHKAREEMVKKNKK